MLSRSLTPAETSRNLSNDLYHSKKSLKYTTYLPSSALKMYQLSFIDTNDHLMIVIFMSSLYVLLTLQSLS